MAAERFANDIETTLNGAINNAVTSIAVVSATGFPSAAQYRVRVNDELMLVTAGAGTSTWTVTRGIEGTAAASHASGESVVHVLTAGALGVVSDPAVGVPGLRTLGTGSTQAAAGDALAAKEDVANKDTTTSLGTSDVKYPSQNAVKSYVDASASGVPVTLLRVFVDYVHGSDANSGLSWSQAFKTIAAAYTALKTAAVANYTPTGNGMGIGTIELAPGDHDVGTGVVIDQNRCVTILGNRNGWERSTTGNFESRIVSSSSAATELILTGSSSVVTYGNRIENVLFYVNTAVNTALTACIRTRANDNVHVLGCGFDASAQTNTCTAIVQNPGGSSQDNAWARIIDNTSRSMPFYKCETGTNFNRSVIDRNVTFYSGTQPAIWLAGEFLCSTVSNNNIEGPTNGPGILVDNVNADWNTFINNSGESGSAANAVYQFNHGNNNVVMGGLCKSTGVIGLFAQFETDAFSNVLVGSYDYVGQSGYARKVVDNSTYGNQIISGAWGPTVRYESGASPALSTADFNTKTPPDGTIVGVTHNTGSGENRVWFMANGAFSSVGTAPPPAPASLTIVQRSSDSSHINSTNTGATLTNDDTLFWAVAGNGTEVWFYEAFLIVNTANATMDIKIGWSTTATGTTMDWGAGWSAGGTAFPGFGAVALASSQATPLTIGQSYATGSTTTKNLLGPSGFVYSGGTPGNVTLQIAQNTANASDLYIAKNSYIRLTKLVD